MPYQTFIDKWYAYFVTWTVVEWLHLFEKAPYRQIVMYSLDHLRTHKRTQLNAFVIMPSHIHAILWPDDGVNLSNVTRDFKRFTSRAISQQAKAQNESAYLSVFKNARLKNRSKESSIYQVWQEGSHAEAIFTEKFARQKLEYIHCNPVRAGLVETADEWPYSSVRAYSFGEETYPPVDLLYVK